MSKFVVECKDDRSVRAEKAIFISGFSNPVSESSPERRIDHRPLTHPPSTLKRSIRVGVSFYTIANAVRLCCR